MKITLIAVGRLRDKNWKKLAREYHDRLKHYRPVDLVDVRESSATRPQERQAEEGRALLDAVPDGAVFVALDERGDELESEKFAAWVEERMVRGTRHLVFAIGGPEGLSDEVRSRADLLMSLSAMTLPHEMARVVLAEQLYRAMTIIRGEPYHR